MGQLQSHTASSGQPANQSTSTMGKRVTAPSATADTHPTPTFSTPPTLNLSAIRTQLKHLSSSLTPTLVDAIKRRDEAAIAQFEALHSQLSALYNHPSLPDEYEVRVHELWNRAETLRTAVNVVEGLRERGKVAVSEMEGEDERDKQREQARTRVEEVEQNDRQQRKQAIELQKLAARRAAEQTAARSKQTKLTGRVSKARKNGTTNKPQQQKKRKVVSESEDEDGGEKDEQNEEPHMEDDNHDTAARNGSAHPVTAAKVVDSEEEEAQLPPTKRTRSPRSSRVTRANGTHQQDSQSTTKAVRQPTREQPPPPHNPTPKIIITPMPRTYTRTPATASATAAKPAQAPQSAQPTRTSPRKPAQSVLRSADKATRPATANGFVTPTAAGTPTRPDKAKLNHVAVRDSGLRNVDQARGKTTKPTAAASRLNLSRLTAAMTPERKKAQPRDQSEEEAGPGVGRTGKRRRSAMVEREDEHDIYDTFDV